MHAPMLDDDSLSPYIGAAKLVRRLPTRAGGFNSQLPSLLAPSPAPSPALRCFVTPDLAPNRSSSSAHATAPLQQAANGHHAVPARSHFPADVSGGAAVPVAAFFVPAREELAHAPRAAQAIDPRRFLSPPPQTPPQPSPARRSLSPVCDAPLGTPGASNIASRASTPHGRASTRHGRGATDSGLWQPARDAYVNSGKRGGSTLGRESRARRGPRTILEMIDWAPANRWQRAVLCDAFQAMLRRRMALLARLRSVFSATIVTLEQRLRLLKPLPLFAELDHDECVKLARMMKPRLVGRYTKVLKAGYAPPAFSGVLWGSLHYTDGRGETVKAGDTCGEGALAGMAIDDSADKQPVTGGGGDRPMTQGGAGDGHSAQNHVPLEPCDLQAAEPSMLLGLRPADITPEERWWWSSMQRRCGAQPILTPLYLSATDGYLLSFLLSFSPSPSLPLPLSLLSLFPHICICPWRLCAQIWLRVWSAQDGDADE